MLTNIAVVAPDGVSPFELSIYYEVFGINRSSRDLPAYDFAFVTPDPSRPVRTSAGLTMNVEHGLDRLADADVVAVAPAKPWDRPYPDVLLQSLCDAVARGTRVMSVCSAAFAVAEAGLLDGRRATTHWMFAAELARRYPQVDVDPGVLYVDADPVLTSAGTAAGIDLCLHLVRKEQGAAVANAIARYMVVSPHRSGGQAQYVETPVVAARPDTPISAVLDWALEHLNEDLSVDLLAQRAHVSNRTFVRHFRSATGSTPYAWVLQQRLLLAERLLEGRHDLSMEGVAAQAGFGAASVMRHHFVRERGISPIAYRQAFLSDSTDSELPAKHELLA